MTIHVQDVWCGRFTRRFDRGRKPLLQDGDAGVLSERYSDRDPDEALRCFGSRSETAYWFMRLHRYRSSSNQGQPAVSPGETGSLAETGRASKSVANGFPHGRVRRNFEQNQIEALFIEFTQAGIQLARIDHRVCGQ